MSRKEGRICLTSIEEGIDTPTQRIENYIKKRGGRLITAARNNADNRSFSRTTITMKQKLK